MNSAVVLLALMGVACATITIPIERLESQREKMIREGTWTAERMQQQMFELANKFTGGDANVPQNNNGDALYVVNVAIGTPAQNFKMLADTGSSNTWVPAKNCGGGGNCPSQCTIGGGILCGFIPNCRSNGCCKNNAAGVQLNSCSSKQDRYDSSASSTYQKDGRTFSIQYGTGSASGILASDIVNLGGVSVRHTFGVANNMANFFQQQPIDGIMGFGWAALAVDHVAPWFTVAGPSLPSDEFTVYMSSHVGPNGGSITLGGLDTTHCSSQINYAPLTSETYWQFQMDGISAGSYSNQSPVQVISDTGTSLLSGPQSDIQQMGQALGGQYNAEYGLFFISCSSNAGGNTINIKINGQTYSIPTKAFIVPAGNGQCILGIGAFNPGAGLSWILGDTWIRAQCNVYDVANKRIGFAKNIAL